MALTLSVHPKCGSCGDVSKQQLASLSLHFLEVRDYQQRTTCEAWVIVVVVVLRKEKKVSGLRSRQDRGLLRVDASSAWSIISKAINTIAFPPEMSSPLGVKRRRVQEATRKLTKPFVSPMRTSKPTPTPLPSATAHHKLVYKPSTLAHTVQLAYPPASSAAPTPKPLSRKSSTIAATPVRRPATTFHSSKKKVTDPAEVAAQKDIASLESQIRRTKNELDTLKQAQHITSSTTDADLEHLTDKWRLASQAIAEDLFGTVKERVCRMGGVAAWREMEKTKHDRMHGIGEFAMEEEVAAPNDADCEFDDEGEELPEDEQEYRKKMKRQAEREMAEAAEGSGDTQIEAGAVSGKEKVWEGGGGEDDVSFGDTLTVCLMMLTFAAVFYDGHDAAIAQYRTRCHWVRQGRAAMDAMTS